MKKLVAKDPKTLKKRKVFKGEALLEPSIVIRILEALIQAFTINGETTKVGSCALKIVDIAVSMGDFSMIALGFSECAIACIDKKMTKLVRCVNQALGIHSYVCVCILLCFSVHTI